MEIPKRVINLLGKKFNRLSVLSYAGVKGRDAFWSCRCDCGNIVEVSTGNLRNGSTGSCGCYKMDMLLERSTTHGLSKTVEYRRWAEMMTRVTNENRSTAHHYIGRGIGVCDEWRNFINFYADMGPIPSNKHTLERVDNDKGYSPDNCIWAPQFVQARNRRGFRDLPVGVYKKRNGRFVSVIGVNGKSRHIGVYDTIDQAVHARTEAELKYWGYSIDRKNLSR